MQALTRPASESKEYVPDAELAERVRQPGQPVFLKPIPQGDFLPSLVTILHTIPSCREMLLDLAHLENYGYNSHWWEGELIDTPEHNLIHTDDAINHELVYEVQRLMAFLEATKRSYGSAEALSQLTQRGQPLDKSATEPLFARFMSCLENAAQSEGEQDSTSMFRIRRIGSETGKWTTQESCYVSITEQDFGMNPESELYEVLDRHVWGRSWPEAVPEYYIDDNVAAIVVLHITKPTPKSTKRRLHIPSTLCTDRYLRSQADAIKYMREQSREYASQVDTVQAQIDNIQKYRPVAGVEMNASQLLHESISFLQQRRAERPEELLVDFESVDDTVDSQTKKRESRDSMVLAHLQEIASRLEAKAFGKPLLAFRPLGSC